ncbi:hypothetical protein DFH08DRAFT_938321 [Mycena albidolilacea]|uniref:Uncharacterized protein n=1 Tax=Mycena albidolilacea TaxID=1033008 RepID=A0AAD6ZVS6_9AGAR|nr:hypothetical protein DFH08DRAFT_938321 [Mycena albidolilacea]
MFSGDRGYDPVGEWRLPHFIHEAFNKVLISPDNTVFQAALHTFWSAHVQESDVVTSSHLSRAGFGKVVQGLRAQFLERKLIKETFVIATPADRDGQDVTVTIVAVLRIEWVQEQQHGHGHHHGGQGRREVVTEVFIKTRAHPWWLAGIKVGERSAYGRNANIVITAWCPDFQQSWPAGAKNEFPGCTVFSQLHLFEGRGKGESVRSNDHLARTIALHFTKEESPGACGIGASLHLGHGKELFRKRILHS